MQNRTFKYLRAEQAQMGPHGFRPSHCCSSVFKTTVVAALSYPRRSFSYHCIVHQLQ